jgi:hypothetical protein
MTEIGPARSESSHFGVRQQVFRLSHFSTTHEPFPTMGKPPDVDFCVRDRSVARVQRLQSHIDILRAEVNQLRNIGVQTRKRRKDEIGRLRRNLNGKSRELWLKMQKMRRLGNLAQCKKLLMYPRDPSHDISPKTLTAEAKLLLAQRQCGMVDHQSEIVQNFQKEMIDYLYTTVLPHIKDEQRMATVSRGRTLYGASTFLILSVFVSFR